MTGRTFIFVTLIAFALGLTTGALVYWFLPMIVERDIGPEWVLVLGDPDWVPIAGGIVVGIVVFLLSGANFGALCERRGW